MQSCFVSQLLHEADPKPTEVNEASSKNKNEQNICMYLLWLRAGWGLLQPQVFDGVASMLL